MMIILEGILVLTAGVAVIYIFYTLGKYINKIYQLRQSTNPVQVRNKHKEQKFIDDLLEDIRKNTDDWFLMDEVAGPSTVLVNDGKNIGIMYSGNGETATILLNLKALTDTKFDKNDEDTVKITIYGNNVAKFIKTAEDIIDRRGH